MLLVSETERMRPRTVPGGSQERAGHAIGSKLKPAKLAAGPVAGTPLPQTHSFPGPWDQHVPNTMINLVMF